MCGMCQCVSVVCASETCAIATYVSVMPFSVVYISVGSPNVHL